MRVALGGLGFYLILFLGTIVVGTEDAVVLACFLGALALLPLMFGILAEGLN